MKTECSENLSLSSDISPENLEIAAPIKKGEETVAAALQELVKAGKEEPPLLYLKDQAGSPLLQYDARLMRRALYIADTGDDEAIYRIGLGYDFGFCSPEETTAIELEAKKAIWRRENANEELERLCVYADTYPKRSIEALLQILEKKPSEEDKDYFRSDDLAKETAFFNAEMAKRVRQIGEQNHAYFKHETDEELAAIGLAWDLDDPEVAAWKGVEPIPPFAPVYDMDVSAKPGDAAAWLLKDEDVREYDTAGHVITTRSEVAAAVYYLATLQKEDPLQYARVAKKLSTAIGISRKDFDTFLRDKTAAKEPDPEILLEDTPRIKEEAAKIIAADQGFNYCVQSWNRSHTGDLPVGKILFIQRGVQCCINTKGIHIHLTGSSAAGKSDAAKCYCDREPKSLVVNADISPRALYYAANLAGEGATVNVDDTVWTDELGNLFKKSTTEFQKGAELLVVNDTKDGRKTVLEKIKQRTAFIMSSVRADAEDQVRDRTLAVPVLSSPARIEQIKGFMAGKFMQPQARANTEEIAICRAIVKDMASHLWEVVIPFANRIDIKGETRAMAMFLDIVCSCATWHYTRREQIEAGAGFGGFNLVATEADFYEAKEIYEGVQGHSREKLTEKEVLILKTVKESGLLTSKEGQRIRVIKRGDLQKLSGISFTALGNYLHGRKHKGGGERGSGLLEKVPEIQFSTYKENITMFIDGGSKIESESKEFIYWLPEDYQVVDYVSVAAKDLVVLKPKV